jgi:uncharacterized protein (TIGR02722 family)
MNFFKILLLVIFVSGCNSTAVKVNTNDDSAPTVIGLGYRDFDEAATELVTSMTSSGALQHPDGQRYVVAIGKIKNDTMQRIDTDQLIKKIRIALLNSRKAVVTSALGGNGAEDEMTYQTRELRNNKEFDQSRVTGSGQLIAPDYSLSGKIIQRNNTVDSRTTQVEYYFMLSLTDIETGLVFWEDEKRIIKRGRSNTVSW